MAYETIRRPEGAVYHYTTKENQSGILKDGRLRRFGNQECWVCSSLEDTLRLMGLTVMQEGNSYCTRGGTLKQYPPFTPEDYIILKMQPDVQDGDWVIWKQTTPTDAPQEVLDLADEFSFLKKGFRGDLKFIGEPEIFEFTDFMDLIPFM